MMAGIKEESLVLVHEYANELFKSFEMADEFERLLKEEWVYFIEGKNIMLTSSSDHGRKPIRIVFDMKGVPLCASIIEESIPELEEVARVESLGEIDLTDESNEVTLNGKPINPGETITIKDGDVLEGSFSNENIRIE